jgi:two-component system chemotaxis sensor kinase CheA
MDDLLRELVTETNESLDVVDVELVRFEQDPNNAKILDSFSPRPHHQGDICARVSACRRARRMHR